MNPYAISLDDVKTLADTAAQLDHVKNFLPAQCAARHEAATLAVQAHATLERILGDDVALVYAPSDEEETAA